MFVNKEGKSLQLRQFELPRTTERNREGMNDWSLMKNK